jgi:hypothetical protein
MYNSLMTQIPDIDDLPQQRGQADSASSDSSAIPNQTAIKPLDTKDEKDSLAESAAAAEAASQQWSLPGIILVSSGLTVIVAAAIVQMFYPGAAIICGSVAIGGVVIAAVGLFWFRREISVAEAAARAASKKLKVAEKDLNSRQQVLITAEQTAKRQLEERLHDVERQEQKLTDRLSLFHEWMEFPLDDLDEEVEVIAPTDSSRSLAEKDRKVIKLLEEESKLLFERIQKNEYSKEGMFDTLKARNDAISLVDRVARIYRPESENPLMETSVFQITRACSRASLQMLVLLEQMPLGVQERNFQELHQYLRQGLRAWRVYKQAEPYMPYVNSAMYLGRFAMGANPVTLGAWWAAGKLTSEGAKLIAKKVIHQQALGFVVAVVRIVGFEAASLYGGDFRHRDSAWIYLAELTDLMSRMPINSENLKQAMREVTRSQLRSEYDRVYLYRCFAGGVSANPQRFEAADFLTASERQKIARKLGRFYRNFVPDAKPKAERKWQDAVLARLKVPVDLSGSEHPPVAEQKEECVRWLASILLVSKQLEPTELAEPLAATEFFVDASEETRERWLEQLIADPPYDVEMPDIERDGPLAEMLLQAAATLLVANLPFQIQEEAIFNDLAVYLDRDHDKAETILERAMVNHVADSLDRNSSKRRFSPEIARAILLGLDDEDNLLFAFDGAKLRDPQHQASEVPGVLIGSEQAVKFVAVGGPTDGIPTVLWQTELEHVRLRRLGGMWRDAAEIVSAKAASEASREKDPQAASTSATATIRVDGSLVSKFENYFQALIRHCGRPE